MRTYLVNQHGVYFCLEFAVDTHTMPGCTLFDSEKQMLEFVCERDNLLLEDLTDTTIFVRQRDGDYAVCDGRGIWTDADIGADTIEQWLNSYEV